MKRYLNAETAFNCIAFLLALHLLGFTFVLYPYVVNKGASWLGLDVSWEMTLNYAVMKDWVWGKDIIYTYGPLGYLGTRIGWGISRWTFLCFDIFLLTNLFFICRDFIRDAADKWLGVLILFVCTLVVEPVHRANITWILMLSSFYWMYRSYKEPKFIYFILCGINIAISFYLKLNAGLVGGALLTGHLINLLLFRKIHVVKALLALLFTGSLIGLGALLFHVSLPQYIKGASEIIKGYNDIMFLDGDDNAALEANVAVLFYGLVLFYLVYAIALVRTKNYSYLFFVLISFVYVFLLRKQGIIRNDFVHYFEFFSYVPLVLITGVFLRPFVEKQRVILFFMLLLSLTALCYTMNRPKKDLNSTFMAKYGSQAKYFSQFADYGKPPFLNNRRKRYIPQRVLRTIGNNSVDIFPWDSEYLLENRLNYAPRPVFQSFSAYTPTLEDKNYEFYRLKGPEYVIYDLESIDNRYAFNDDLPVNFFLYKNYTFADSFTSNGSWRMLLKKRSNAEDLIWQEAPITDTFRLNKDSIAIQWNWVKVLKVDLELNNAGKFQALWYRSPSVKIELVRPGKGKKVYKASVQMLKAGIQVDRWINGNRDFYKYMQDRDGLDVIAYVRIVADSPALFKNKYSVKYYNIK